VTHVTLSDRSPDRFYALLGRRPEILEAWSRMDEAMMGGSSTLPTGLKEEVRATLAQGIGCRYCASMGQPAEGELDRRASLAVGFAELVAQDHRSVDAKTFDVLREDFSEEEIVELCAWICFKYGANMLGAITGLDPGTPDQIEAYQTWLAGEDEAKASLLDTHDQFSKARE
jgi:alkylhydroperoxidase family enzyme